MSKSTSTKAHAVTVAETPSTHLVFGLNFNLHGTMVPVSTDDIANAKAKGIEFTLPERVNLGTLTDFQAWFKKQFGIDLPLGTDLPPPLGAIMNKLTTLDVSVEQFHVKIPGTDTPDAPKLYTLAMSAIWPADGGIPLIPGVLTIDGAVFGASNEPPKTNG
ncbi:hypothetical protein [Burkholderia ubonensis]|uniref:hypothetical protein n=1 Tax=Burkholderia ubonensis TaxID=101571 RepID=UPI00117773C0|nr:hypothetical protein [Burkholderia ubonensis]